MLRLKRIMLIDDNRYTNFYNKVILGQMIDVKDFIECNNGKDALTYFEGDNAPIDVIFLDINMPLMNGWEYLKAHQQLNISNSKEPIVIMLTSSPNKDDEDKTKEYSIIKKYICKPLTPRAIQETIDLIT